MCSRRADAGEEGVLVREAIMVAVVAAAIASTKVVHPVDGVAVHAAGWCGREWARHWRYVW
jgi:hypothetical protein